MLLQSAALHCGISAHKAPEMPTAYRYQMPPKNAAMRLYDAGRLFLCPDSAALSCSKAVKRSKMRFKAGLYFRVYRHHRKHKRPANRLFDPLETISEQENRKPAEDAAEDRSAGEDRERRHDADNVLTVSALHIGRQRRNDAGAD